MSNVTRLTLADLTGAQVVEWDRWLIGYQDFEDQPCFLGHTPIRFEGYSGEILEMEDPRCATSGECHVDRCNCLRWSRAYEIWHFWWDTDGEVFRRHRETGHPPTTPEPPHPLR